MSKLFLFMMTTIDGFFEGPNQELDWHNVDDEFNEFAISQLNDIGTLLFGRITYQMMASYWPTKQAIEDDVEVAEKMNNLPKIVFSRTLDKAEWNNTVLIKENIAEEVVRLKQQSSKDLAIFGSSDLTVSLASAGLVDEYRIMVNPVILGNGRQLLKGINEELNLKLIKTRVFKSGNVLHYYQPGR